MLSITTVDSKHAKNEGYRYINDLFTIWIFPLIKAMIDILETATEFM